MPGRASHGRSLLPLLATGAAAVLATALAYLLFGRPWIRRWGATDEEVHAELHGDDLVPESDWISTRAITIDAPPERVWPWLAQIGYRRAGWYSYDWLHRLLGAAGSVDDPRRSARRVVPALQDVKPGDIIRIFKAGPFAARQVTPPHMLLLTSGEGDFKVDPVAGGMSWVWHLVPQGSRTRLVVRTRMNYGNSLPLRLLHRLVTEPGGFIMEQRTMRSLKERSESAD